LRDKLTVIISDVNGSKHYTVSQIIKKIILYVVLAIVLLFVIGGLYIKFLLNEVQDINKRKVVYEQQSKELLKQNKKLFLKVQSLSKEIKQKKEELENINDKIADLEDTMGIRSNENETLDSRIDSLKVTSLQRKLFFNDIPNGSPVPYLGITAKFGWRIHPILKRKEYHPGLDMRAKMGEKVRASADGLVEFAGFHKRSGYGNLIILDHNYGFKTLYGHLKKVLVKNNQFVKKGQVIGLVGNTGLSTGHHLHYGIMYLQKFLNPYYFVKWNNKNFEYIFKKERRVKWQSLIKAIQNQIQLLSQQVQK
jgi:murein DD-endopeptidase MepM/ murein hydrolase activator NlpD